MVRRIHAKKSQEEAESACVVSVHLSEQYKEVCITARQTQGCSKEEVSTHILESSSRSGHAGVSLVPTGPTPGLQVSPAEVLVMLGHTVA